MALDFTGAAGDAYLGQQARAAQCGFLKIGFSSRTGTGELAIKGLSIAISLQQI